MSGPVYPEDGNDSEYVGIRCQTGRCDECTDENCCCWCHIGEEEE
jgi:hypothetical protein